VYISANSASPDRVGDQIWLIAGEGRQKRYFLAYWFIAERVVPATATAKARLYGTALGVGNYREALNDNPIFRKWYLRPQHYSHGLTRLHPELVSELKRLTDSRKSRVGVARARRNDA
jgi:hypothetical protein